MDPKFFVLLSKADLKMCCFLFCFFFLKQKKRAYSLLAYLLLYDSMSGDPDTSGCQ